ncbi:unnamed protein product [Adineta steineri]|uniref:DJ-1/PfpI domain-containing protein n=1 Tax=Adineta steineri TaxID=433720 RepID=A0A813Q8U3_9BILA|nr:unnamed protein product [Adineta steineri]
MEENLLNEIENFTSIKYLDDVTNNDHYCNDDEQDNSLVHQLAIKDKQLILAAKCGKVLLEQKDELERQIDIINRDYQQRIDVLEQERHELRLLVEQVQSECETKIIELNEDKCEMRRQLDDLRREQRVHDEQQTQIIQELTEINYKLTQDLQISRTTESRLQEQLRLLRQQSDTVCQTNTEQIHELSAIKQQFENLHCQQIQLELDHHLLLDERDTLAHKLDECQRKYISIEDEYRSLQATKFQNEKELNDAHDLIHRLSQYGPDNHVPPSFMQELHEDFGIYPDGNTRFNSTIIDEDNNTEDCQMEEDDDDGVEISQTHSSSFINEKCLLDELLQTEEFKREIVLVYKQLRSLCLELIYIHTHTYSNDNSISSSSISDTVDKVYDRLQNGCLISILFELKNLIKDMIENEDLSIYKNENNILPNSNTILPSPSIATINSYTSAYDDINLILIPSSPPILDVGITTGLYEPPKRILVVCSSHSRGLYLSEFAEPYNILRRKFQGKEGIEFVLASPKGGSIPIDPTSHPRTNTQRDEWSSAIRLLSQSTHPILDTQHAHDYDAVFLPGGHAPMFDLADHSHLKQLLADFDQQMKPIAAICHGVVGLVNVRRNNDEHSFIHGRILTGFSLDEELLSSSGQDENFVTKNPFILETKLKDQGAIYIKTRPNKEHIVQDGLLLTGQNPASAKQLAHRLGELIDQCASQDYQQINLTSSLPKTLITCHVALTNNNSQLLSRLKLAHLEYIQRHQHLIIFSGSTLFTESSNVTQQDSSTMVILLATNDLRQAQNFIEHEPYTASKQIFDITHIKPFKQLLPSGNNQYLLNYHVQQEQLKEQQQQQQQQLPLY